MSGLLLTSEEHGGRRAEAETMMPTSILLSADYAAEGRSEDAMREANLAMLLRPNEAIVHYNAACTFCELKKKEEAMEALRKAWRAGFKDSDWARRDPDLALLHDDPEFDELYPEAQK